MPFQSKAQQRFMFAKHPEMAKEWAEKTPDISKLPEHTKKMAFGGETNPVHETLKAMEDNPTAGFDEGGEAGVDERSPDYPTSAMTGSDIPMGLMALLGMPEAASTASEIPAALEGLGETGSISLGGAAPEMEGMAPKVEVFSKGAMGKGTPNEMTIWGVKGDPEEIAKLGYGTDPASIPEHVLKQHGLLPEMKIDASNMASPNEYAKGGEVNKVNDLKDLHKLTALRGIAHGSTNPSPPMNYADGGDVMNMGLNALSATGIPGLSDLGTIADLSGMVIPPSPQAPQGPQPINPQSVPPPVQPLPASAANPIMQASQQAKNTPATNPSIYQGITADQRAALMQKLLAQKASPGNLTVSGIAGLGDAVSNAFGKGGQNAQGAVREAQAKNVENQIGVIDTQRAQRMQDLQANLAQQENDPSSEYSKGMRQFYSQLTGKQFPSGISASMMKSAFPDYAKIFDSQLTAATAQAGQKVEAQKAGAAQSPWRILLDKVLGNNPAENALQKTATGGASNMSSGTKQTTPSGISYTVSQ